MAAQDGRLVQQDCAEADIQVCKYRKVIFQRAMQPSANGNIQTHCAAVFVELRRSSSRHTAIHSRTSIRAREVRPLVFLRKSCFLSDIIAPPSTRRAAQCYGSR